MAMCHKALTHPLIAEASGVMKIQPTLTTLRACFRAKDRTRVTVSRELVALMCPELCTNACAVYSSGVAVRAGAGRVWCVRAGVACTSVLWYSSGVGVRTGAS